MLTVQIVVLIFSITIGIIRITNNVIVVFIVIVTGSSCVSQIVALIIFMLALAPFAFSKVIVVLIVLFMTGFSVCRNDASKLDKLFPQVIHAMPAEGGVINPIPSTLKPKP